MSKILEIEKLKQMFSVLNTYLGDSDPDLPDDMTDDEIKEEEPIFWVAKELSRLIEKNKHHSDKPEPITQLDDKKEVKMECPHGHGEMEWDRRYINVGRSGCSVHIWICQECAFSFAEVR